MKCREALANPPWKRPTNVTFGGSVSRSTPIADKELKKTGSVHDTYILALVLV